MVYRTVGKLPEAMADVENAMRLSPNTNMEWQPYYARALINFDMKKYTAALDGQYQYQPQPTTHNPQPTTHNHHALSLHPALTGSIDSSLAIALSLSLCSQIWIGFWYFSSTENLCFRKQSCSNH